MLQDACCFWFFLFCVFLFSPRVGAEYDRSFTLFSDRGELLQVQYARLAGLKGEPVLCGIPADGGGKEVLLCSATDRDRHALLDRRFVEKIMRVDDHVFVAFSGLAGDGRALVQSTREFCVQFFSQFSTKPSVLGVATHIASLQHKATLAGGKRPYGVQLLVIGINEHSEDAEVYKTEPSGHITRCLAAAIGKNSDSLTEKLEEAWTCGDSDKANSTPSRRQLSRLFSRLLHTHKQQIVSESESESNHSEDEAALDLFLLKRDDEVPNSVVLKRYSEVEEQ